MVYHDLPKTEDCQELLVNADSDASSVNEEDKQWASSRASSGPAGRAAKWGPGVGRSWLSALREYAWLFTMGLMALIVVLQLAILHQVRSQGRAASNSATQPGGDYTGQGPICS